MALRRTHGSMIGSDALIPPELIADLAKSAKLRPLVHPPMRLRSAATPVAGPCGFCACRDLTCRFPGCDKPAMHCDLDHTVPYADGGRTQASNLKCLCRLHHLIKDVLGPASTINCPTARWCGHRIGADPCHTPAAPYCPSLCVPTGTLTPPDPHATRLRCVTGAQ